jgi:hypothetical protein
MVLHAASFIVRNYIELNIVEYIIIDNWWFVKVFWCCGAPDGNMVGGADIPPLPTMGNPSSGRILIIGNGSSGSYGGLLALSLLFLINLG